MKQRTRQAMVEAIAITTLSAGFLFGVSSGLIETEPGMTRTTGCAVRLVDAGPYLHANSQHICDGVSSVSVLDNGDLKFTGLDNAPIVSMTCEEDETLTRAGISCGMSGGSGTAIARLYSSKTGGPIRADHPVVTSPSANLWLTFVHGLR